VLSSDGQGATAAGFRATAWNGLKGHFALHRLKQVSQTLHTRRVDPRFASLVGKYWIERFARLQVEIDVASECRYREAPVGTNGLTVVITRSGETAVTLASLRYVKDTGSKTVGVVNVPTSSIARLTDAAAPALAGPKIGFASTKAFTCQLAVMACLAISLGRARHAIDEAREAALLAQLA
jgi:glutamine---fructose-6-phosphate transaminase (isomerizing)